VRAMAQIFLCYARLDQQQVEGLYNRLSDSGFKPWMDKKDILPGEKWELAIQKAIRSSDFFLACLSANSVNRRGVIQKEIKEALDIWKEKLDSDIYLIPVRLEDCEVPESLRCFQWVNLFEEDGWERLVKAIQIGMDRQEQVTEAAAIEARGTREAAVEKWLGDAEATAKKLGQVVEALRQAGLQDEHRIAEIIRESSRAMGYEDYFRSIEAKGTREAAVEKGLGDAEARAKELVQVPQMPKVFISHSSKDDRFVQRLAGDLRGAGVEVWVDDRITVGDEFVGEINQGLFDSDYVAVVLSTNSIKSRWVEKEYSASLSREVRESEKIVLPLLTGNIADCDIPPLLSNKNYADFRRDYEAGLGALLQALMPGAGLPQPFTVEAPQLVFESELRKEWGEIRPMLEMMEQLAPECKEQVNALREARSELEACVVKGNECRFFYETAQWRKATEVIARFVSSEHSDPHVTELAGEIGARLASAFYCAGYRFYARDCCKEAQALFDQAVKLNPMHVEAVQIREKVAKILAKSNEDLAVHFAEAEEAAYRGRYEDVVRIVDHIRNSYRCYQQSELDRLLTVARLRQGGAP